MGRSFLIQGDVGKGAHLDPRSENFRNLVSFSPGRLLGHFFAFKISMLTRLPDSGAWRHQKNRCWLSQPSKRVQPCPGQRRTKAMKHPDQSAGLT